MKEYKYIDFMLIHFNRDSRKLQYLCSNKNGEDLGTVEWYDLWNQYVYKSFGEIIYSNTCLTDIIDFVSSLNNLKNK